MVQKFSGSNKQTKNTIALRENMKECFIKFYVKIFKLEQKKLWNRRKC